MRQYEYGPTCESSMPPGTMPHHSTPENPPRTGRRMPNRKRANITIATLNINGFSAPANNMSGMDKWSAINRTISDNKIAILALQETHLDQSLLQDVTTCFGKRLEVINSQHPTNPRTTAGVAFVINKSLIKPRDYKLYELEPGRAVALKVRWLENEETVLINIYAPNA